MKEFSDEFLKELINQKEVEFEPQDHLSAEWSRVAKKLPLRSVRYYTVAFLLGVTALSILVIKYPNVDSQQNGAALTVSRSEDKQPIEKRSDLSLIDQKNNHQQESRTEGLTGINQTASKKKFEIPLQNLVEIPSLATQESQTAKSSGETIEQSEIPAKEIAIVSPILQADSASVVEKEQIKTSNNQEAPNSWMVLAELFFNSNQFIPTQGDAIFIESFEQSENLFFNRIGIKLSIASPSVKTVFGKISGTIAYGFLPKHYSFQYLKLNSEQVSERATYSVESFNHMLSSGIDIQFHPRISVGAEYQFIVNSGNGEDAFAPHNVLLRATGEIFQKNKFRLRAFAEYGIPLQQSGFLRVQQMNVGVQVPY